jgi:hypothetical protein
MSRCGRSASKRFLHTASMTGAALLILSVWGTLRFGSFQNALAYVSGERLLVDSATKSFGSVESGIDQRIYFLVSNWSDRSISILGAGSQCAVTLTENLPLIIPPKSSRRVNVRLRTETKVGKVSESVRLYTDSAYRPELVIRVVGLVKGVAPSDRRT